MINFRELCKEYSNQTIGHQKKIFVDSCLEVFWGYNCEGNLRLSFMSKKTPATIESTKILHVIQGRENEDTYWTSFDLLNPDLSEAYYSFCENMIDSITGITDEKLALVLLNRRFHTWKRLFQKNATCELSKEKLLGIFGELIALKKIIIPQYGIETAIKSWGGPDMHSKDFTLNNTWYEIKTIGANADNIHISSIAQLSSVNTGHLLVIRAETVSSECFDKSYSIIDMAKDLLLDISDEHLENILISKLQSAGIDIYEKKMYERYDVKSISSYIVNDEFPKITTDNVPFSEITGLQYEISVAAIHRFKEV